MTDEPEVYILVGLPADTSKRRYLKKAMGVPVPQPYTGSIQVRCTKCRMKIWIGPRQQQVRGVLIYCPWCAADVSGGEIGEIVSLGNQEPESARKKVD